MGDIHLKNVIFNPPHSVVFEPIMTRQKIVFEITNNEKVDILVKWKSTRPGVYHMAPTYSIIASGTTSTTDLVCKGITRNQCSRFYRDRFSIVIAPILPTKMEARSIWKDFDAQTKLIIGKMVKKNVFILYAGVNDTVDFSVNGPGEPARQILPDLVIVKRESEENLSEHDDLKTTRTAGIFTQIFIPIANSSAGTIFEDNSNLSEDS